MGDPATMFPGTTSSSVTSFNITMTSPNTSVSNITEEERLEYLRHLDAEKWPYIYPVIVYLLILMVIGIIGNSLVFVVYLKNFKPSTTRLFILTLAVFDLLTCSLSIPGVIVELRFHYTFFFPALCKIFRFSRMYFVLVSMFTLIIIAVDRYRKVCRPLQRQYTIRSAGLSILVTNIVAVVLTVLGAVVGGNRTVPTDRKDVFGANCSYDDKYLGTPITKFYSGILFLLFIVCVVLLIVLYSLIGRQVFRHRTFRFKPKKAEGSSSGTQTQTGSTEMQNVPSSSSNKHKVVEKEVSSGYMSEADEKDPASAARGNSMAEVSSEKMSGTDDISLLQIKKQKAPTKPKPKSDSPKEKSNGGKKQSTGKTTFTLFIITVVFIVSFLPFLVLVALWGSNWKFVNSLHGYMFTVFKMLFHSYHINNVINCYVYGFCNPRFRNELKRLLCSRKGSMTLN
ncbi:orexin receptor type 2-like [Haliotis rufescens]|uniref:orexin receptor type 2-like n=1 Tax=Haliotis rufescens TaxID=6454 RepID=UPI00201EEE42|nr:orexin receptor type 2-like [Haliotis rufescens]XP_046346468.2 orexin receptor type 2-like [Haliotis rufescens]